MVKIILATHGSLGDLHPFMALGLALQARGAEIVLASHPDYEGKVSAAGLTFLSYGASRETYVNDLRMNPQDIISRLTRDHGFMIKRLIAPYLIPSVEAIRPVVAEADLVIGSSFAYGAHMAAMLEDKPFTVIALQPTVMMSVYDPPKVKKAPFIFNPKGALSRQYNRLIVWAGEQFMASTQSTVRRVYRYFDLTPRISLGGIISDHQTIALYDELMGQLEPDFPPHSHICGFSYYDSADGHVLRIQPNLEAFLAQGPAPLVFSLGSAVVDGGEAFYREAITATHALNARAVLLVGSQSPLLSEELGPDILAIDYAPHSLLFPQASVIIHHGGIGSTAQAVRSGRPQLVTPVFADQFDNARRIERLGVGGHLNYDRWGGKRAAKAIGAIRDDPQVATTAVAISQKLSGRDGARVAADVILKRIGA